MAAETHNITIEQGATWTLDVTVTLNGAAWDLTDYIIRMQVRLTYVSKSTVLDLTESNGRVIRDPSTNKFQLKISAADTAALAFDTARYDLELQDTSGKVTRLLQGRATLSREITR